jgi:hypothetical protein
MGLCTDEHDVFFCVAEELGGALLALCVELLDDIKDVVAGLELDDALARWLRVNACLRDEQVLSCGADVLGEDAACDACCIAVAGNEDVEQRVVKMDCPGADLVPGAAGEVQGHGGQGVFEHLVVLRL